MNLLQVAFDSIFLLTVILEIFLLRWDIIFRGWLGWLKRVVLVFCVNLLKY